MDNNYIEKILNRIVWDPDTFNKGWFGLDEFIADICNDYIDEKDPKRKEKLKDLVHKIIKENKIDANKKCKNCPNWYSPLGNPTVLICPKCVKIENTRSPMTILIKKCLHCEKIYKIYVHKDDILVCECGSRTWMFRYEYI
jgi:hypothetical protein